MRGQQKTRVLRTLAACALLRVLLNSGEPIRTTDLRVMRVEPEIVTFDLRVRRFYEPLVRWFL